MPKLGVRWCCLCPMPVNTNMLAFKGDEVKNAQQFASIMKPMMIE